MSSAETSISAELLSMKRTLIKTAHTSLGGSDTLADAIRLTTQLTIPDHHQDQLALLLALLKHIRLAIPSNEGKQRELLLEAVRQHIAPAVQPGCSIAELLNVNLERPYKPNQLRAAECAQALGRLVAVIAPISPDAISVVPLFTSVCRSGLAAKPSLMMVQGLLEGVPTGSLPTDLLEILLEGLSMGDHGSIRSAIAVEVLKKQRAGDDGSSNEQLVELVMPLLSSAASPVTTTNVHRYLLPALCKAFPDFLSLILSELASTPMNGEGDTDDLSTWISVASLGVSLGLLDLQALPQSDLHAALEHEDALVRKKAFDLVVGSKDVAKLLTPAVMALIRKAFVVNSILPGMGSRSDFSSSTHVFFVNLKEAEAVTRRRMRKGNADNAEDPKIALDVLAGFHQWFLTEYIEPALISARRIPVYRPLLALHLLEIYIGIFGENAGIQAAVYSEKRVQLLIGCQASEFTEVRGRSRNILKSAPTPLPGYPDIDSPNAQALLRSAYASFSNPRRTQNDAAVAALCILFEKVLYPADADSGVAFVRGLIDRLENELQRAEKGIKLGLDDLALHGLIGAARALLGCVSLQKASAENTWKSTFHRLFALVRRVWQLTRTIMSLSTPTPGVPGTLIGKGEPSPAHEIAKAYQVLANAADEDEIDGDVDPRRILSACWRATKEASDLLSLLFAHPLLHGGSGQIIWSRDDINTAGKQYLEWMHEIRHRGTFSKVAIHFARFVDAVKTVPSLANLADEWLELELDAITNDASSTTRRSAALPYSLLSIVAGDGPLLGRAINRLIDLSRLDNPATSDVTRVHCFNILKIVLLDARQTVFFDKYFERTVMTAVAAFSSANWNVRNVGLILFSTLVHRSLTPSRGTQDVFQSRMALATRQTYAGWHSRHPALLPYMIEYMDKHAMDLDGSGRAMPTQHTPLFPMLIIIRTLQWSEKGAEIQEGLKRVVRPHLASAEIKVREVTAQALSSLFSPSEALAEMIQWPAVRRSDYNAIHGRLLNIKSLIINTIDWSAATSTDASTIEAFFLRIFAEYGNLSCPPIDGALFGCVSAYLEHGQPTLDFRSWATTTAGRVVQKPRARLPGADSLAWQAGEIVLQQPTSEVLLTLLTKSAEQDRLSTLWRIPDLPSTGLTAEVFRRVLDMATDRKSGDAVQIVALDTVASTWVTIPWAEDVLQSVPQDERARVSRAIRQLVTATSVPLKEAALPAMAWATMWARAGASVELDRELSAQVAAGILDASAVTQSQPRREIAARALSKLTTFLFPASSTSTEAPIIPATLLILHQSLLRLLQDDDEDVRLIAADIVKEGLGLRRAVIQARAVEVWWEWLGGYLPSLTSSARTTWVNWLEEMVLNKADLEEDLAILHSQHNPDPSHSAPVELFGEEKPNLFRDPLDDARAASALLATLRAERLINNQSGSSHSSRELVIAALAADAGVGVGTAGNVASVSPIDEAFRVVHIMPEYRRILRLGLPDT